MNPIKQHRTQKHYPNVRVIRVLKCFLKHATKSKLAGERNKLGFGAKVWKAESPLVFR